MKIILAPHVSARLETFARLYPREFSGFGFIDRTGKDELTVYDIVLLDIGSEVYTEISTSMILNLMTRPDADKMKLWFHRHPIDNWSATDMDTILNHPMGGIPQLVKWSAAIVLTPHGWIGRVDNHISHTAVDCQVEPNELTWAWETLRRIVGEKSKSAPVPFVESPIYVQRSMAWDDLDASWYEEQLANQDLSEEEREDLLDRIDAGELELLPIEEETEEEYNHPIEPGKQITGITKSSWWKRNMSS
jgi:hypothetical protein